MSGELPNALTPETELILLSSVGAFFLGKLYSKTAKALATFIEPDDEKIQVLAEVGQVMPLMILNAFMLEALISMNSDISVMAIPLASFMLGSIIESSKSVVSSFRSSSN